MNISTMRADARVETAIAGVAALAGLLLIFRGVVAEYYPRGDEYALIVESTPYARPLEWRGWVTSGYSKYFRPIPDWTDPFTNFIRPGANLCYLVNFALWRDHWRAYLYLNYTVLATGAAMAFWLARRFLGCPLPLSIASAALVALNPAVGAATQWPSFILDAAAAIQAGAAFLFVTRRRFGLALTLLVTALFTKETVAFAPFAAGITWSAAAHGADRRLRPIQLGAAALLVGVPIGLWIGARYLAFGTLSGVYAVRGIYTHLDALLRWPLGLDGALAPELFTGPLKAGRWSAISPLAAGGAVLTICVWGAGAYLLARTLRRRAVSETGWRLVLLAPWIVGLVVLLTALNLGPRFGYFLYLFGIPMTAYAAHRLWSRGRAARLACLLPALVGAALLVPAANLLAQVQSDSWMRRYIEEGRRARSLIEFLGQAGDRYERLYVLNDFVGAFAGAYLGAFAGARCPVTVLNGVEPAPSNTSEMEVSFMPGDDRSLGISVALSKDLRLEYWGAYRLRDLLRTGAMAIGRGMEASYWLPEPQTPERDRRLDIRLSSESRYAVVYYDTRLRRFSLYDSPRARERSEAISSTIRPNAGGSGSRTMHP